jgi:hypothetical protein
MWYHDPTSGKIRHSLYVASMNHREVGEGYGAPATTIIITVQ